MMIRGTIIISITLAIGWMLTTFGDPVGFGQIWLAGLMWGGFILLIGIVGWIRDRRDAGSTA